jgi:hypothetical protein
MSFEPDHIYLDAICSNNDNGSNTPSIFLQFNEIRDNPILQNCNDWYLSIVRFYLSTPNLPLLIVPVLTGQADPNKTSLSVSLTYKNYEYQQYIQFAPENIVDPTPAPPLIKQDFSTSYYELYSYQYFISLLNNALVSCLSGLSALVSAGGDTLPSSYVPYFELDTSSERATLYTDISGYDKTLTNPIKLYMNTALFQWFSSFDAIYQGSNNIINGKNYLFNIYTTPNNGNIYTIGNPYISGSTVINYILTFQEYATLGILGNPISSIIFTTSLIPVCGSLISRPVIFNAANNVAQQTQNSTVINMLTDITVGLDLGFEYKPSIIYNANPYRLIPLQSNQPLRNYDLTVMWKDHFGNIKPFLLSPGSCSSIKILFRKKSLGV